MKSSSFIIFLLTLLFFLVFTVVAQSVPAPTEDMSKEQLLNNLSDRMKKGDDAKLLEEFKYSNNAYWSLDFSPYNSQYNRLRGDLYKRNGKVLKALYAYQKAGPNTPYNWLFLELIIMFAIGLIPGTVIINHLIKKWQFRLFAKQIFILLFLIVVYNSISALRKEPISGWEGTENLIAIIGSYIILSGVILLHDGLDFFMRKPASPSLPNGFKYAFKVLAVGFIILISNWVAALWVGAFF